jgi:hypothetical protein
MKRCDKLARAPRWRGWHEREATRAYNLCVSAKLREHALLIGPDGLIDQLPAAASCLNIPCGGRIRACRKAAEMNGLGGRLATKDRVVADAMSGELWRCCADR